MIRKTIITLLLLACVSTFAQDVTLEEISNNILQIEADTTFTLTEQDQLEQTKVTFDGGYHLKIWHHRHDITKIVAVIGLSYGSIQTTVYLTNNIPIKIIESEEVFAETPYGLNYKKLNKTYKVTHDILNWKHQKIITKEKGTRVFNNPKKAIFDYMLLIDSAKQAIDK
ncbi:hypothetical protein [Tenacibaculum larymnensis]|uniref:DUF4468 domain-containing protein n=1 Tax=Tenacibaculum larymnensis TaxID=2878201 RepID=A0A9X4IQB4_9FLAO|nr:hypothetical protein [Tenacibaculum larymnensis]MDE1207670.1 hypothetical protein [Tenacibaculum larymnensis]